MKVFAWWLFFALIELVNVPLIILGLFICLWPALAKGTRLWWNDDDGDLGLTGWPRYKWLALRNPVANFRKIPGISGQGRPLLYKRWTSTPEIIKSGHYIKVGWESGFPYYPVFQPFGSGRGY